MLLHKYIYIIFFTTVILFGQSTNKEIQSVKVKKDSLKSVKKWEKKNEIIFSNDEDTQAYIDMFKNVLGRVKESYVDSINESEIIKSGIKGMMKPLDPYTKFLSGSSKDRLDELRTGKYGGIGIQIGLRRDTLTVLRAFENSPAYSEGLYSGDQIIMIDSIATYGMNLKDASKQIKGELGSVVNLTIYRRSERKRITFELTRSNIIIKHVPYWGVDENGIGYIRITKFSRNTAKDFSIALRELKDLDMLGLVIDLRSNSGGLLNNAINILDKLTDRGVNLLNTRGRIKKSNKKINSRRIPVINEEIPIAVLINQSSASASEIVSGALQDLDRAVIVGTKSFGKGLVQSMYNLNDTTTIKVTTAKYYIPSGRLIQRPYNEGLDEYYNIKSIEDTSLNNKTLHYTKKGRIVYGGGGIWPDYIVKLDNQHLSYLKSKLRINPNRPIFRYAANLKDVIKLEFPTSNSFYDKIQLMAQDSTISLIDYNQFEEWLIMEKINYNPDSLYMNWNYIENDILSEIGGALWDKNMNYKIKALKDLQILETIKNLNNK